MVHQTHCQTQSSYQEYRPIGGPSRCSGTTLQSWRFLLAGQYYRRFPKALKEDPIVSEVLTWGKVLLQVPLGAPEGPYCLGGSYSQQSIIGGPPRRTPQSRRFLLGVKSYWRSLQVLQDDPVVLEVLIRRIVLLEVPPGAPGGPHSLGGSYSGYSPIGGPSRCSWTTLQSWRFLFVGQSYWRSLQVLQDDPVVLEVLVRRIVLLEVPLGASGRPCSLGGSYSQDSPIGGPSRCSGRTLQSRRGPIRRIVLLKVPLGAPKGPCSLGGDLFVGQSYRGSLQVLREDPVVAVDLGVAKVGDQGLLQPSDSALLLQFPWPKRKIKKLGKKRL